MYKIIFSDAFERALFRFLKRHKELREEIYKRFHQLEIDIRNPSLRTHKLHGSLSKYYACNITFDYRLIFRIDSEFIYPQSIGKHDDVY